jgi:predicted ribosomally synthesized peptide with nif11-like leader
MTTDQVQAFLNAVKSDPTLQAALQKPDADPVAVAASAGYTFSAEQLQSGLSQLTEQELEQAAGGMMGAGPPLNHTLRAC